MKRSDNDNSVLSLRVLYTAAILAALFKLEIRQVRSTTVSLHHTNDPVVSTATRHSISRDFTNASISVNPDHQLRRTSLNGLHLLTPLVFSELSSKWVDEITTSASCSQ